MAGGSAKYEIFIVADASQAEAVMARLGTTVGKTGRETEQQAPKMARLSQQLSGTSAAGRVAASQMDDVAASLTSRLGPGAVAAGIGVEALDTKLGGLNLQGRTAVVAGAAAAGAAIGVGAAYAIAAKGVQVYVDKAGEVAKLRGVTRQSMEDASKLSNLLGDLGISTDAAAKSFAIFGANVEKGKLADYGIETARAADGTLNFVATLENARTAISQEEDAAKRAAMARALFGRGYLELSRYLGMAADEFERYKDAAAGDAIISDADLKNVRELQKAQNDLNDALEKFWVTIGQKVTPALTDMLNAAEPVVNMLNNLSSVGTNFSDGMIRAVSALNPALEGPLRGLAAYGSAQTEAKDATDESRDAVDDWSNSLEEGEDKVTSFADAVANYADAQIAARRAALSLEEATTGWDEEQAEKAEQRAERVRQAREDEADAERDLARAKADAAQAVEDAEQNVADTAARAAEQVAAARRRTAEAERRLADARKRDNRDARSIFDAQRDLARVQEDIAAGRLSGMDAVRAQQDAETDLNRAQEDAAENERDRQRRIADAEREVKEARAAERKAEIEGSQQVKRAREDLARARVAAERTIEQAQRRVAEAAKKVTEAQNAQGVSARELRKHQLDVEAATLANAKAQRNLKSSVAEVNKSASEYGITLSDIDDVVRALGLKNIPRLRTELGLLATAWQNAATASGNYYAAPGSSYAPGGSTYNSQVPAAGRASQGVSAAGGSANISVNVSGAIITDPKAAEALGRTVAKGVAAEFQAMKAQGRRVI